MNGSARRTAGALALVLAMLPAPLVGAPVAQGQGGSTISSIGQVLGWVEAAIDGFEPSRETGRTSGQPFVSADRRYRIDTAWQQDTLTLIIEASERYIVPGASPDSAAHDVTDSGGTTLQVDVCPDEDGTVTVSANASGTYDVVGEGLSYHATLDTRDVATVTVGPDAEIAGRQHLLTVRGSAAGDRPAFLGGEGAVGSELDASLAWSGALSDAAADVSVATAEGVDARDLRSAFAGGAFTAALVDAAIDAAARVWQDGRCLELVVEPPGGPVDPGSETEITVSIEHKAFEDDIERDVRVTALEGTEKVEPLDEPIPAAATFTYTATSEPRGQGAITFRTVSNRGIAERTETYTVEQRLLLDAEGTVRYSGPGVSARGTLKGRGLEVRLIPGETPEDAPGVTVTGDLQVSLQARSAGCSGDGTKRYPVDSAVDASARVVGEGDERQLSVLIRPAQPSAQVRVRVRCDGRGVTMSFPLGILFPHFERGGEVLIPIGGGSGELRSNVQGVRSRFAFTLRQEQ